VSDSGEGSDERLPAYPVTTQNMQIVDQNNSVWISPPDKPVVMRIPQDSLRNVPNKASTAISETYDINPFQNAKLVDREGNIWFGDASIEDRKRAEEEALQQSQVYLVEGQRLAYMGSWAWRSPDRKVVHLSEEFYRIYGFYPAKGAPTWEEYFERVHPRIALNGRARSNGQLWKKPITIRSFRILFPNGKVKWIHTVGHAVLSGAGDLEQFVGSSTTLRSSNLPSKSVKNCEN
jgi:PAS fold